MSVKKTLLFSDVHLKTTVADQPHQKAFLDFLRNIDPEVFDRVICLGDLFDFWFEYSHAVFSGYFPILRAFAGLRDAGVELHLVCGNHDFWAGRFLETELGFNIHRTSVVLPFGEKRAHLVHGDGLNPRDKAYRLYKRFARNPLAIHAFRLIHPDWAMALARLASSHSRRLTHVADTAQGPEAQALKAYAREVLGRGEAEVVLCGHAHAPVREEFPMPNGMGLYLNTGDWLIHRSHVVWDGEFNLILGS